MKFLSSNFRLFALALIVVSGCSSNSSPSENDRISIAVVELASVRESLALFFDLPPEAASLSPKIAQSVVRHVLLVRAADPPIGKLRGEALETMCLLNEPRAEEIFRSVNDDELVKIARQYLSESSPRVQAEISRIQKSMKGKGCYLSPQLD